MNASEVMWKSAARVVAPTGGKLRALGEGLRQRNACMNGQVNPALRRA